jgi:hypothetical protein
VAKDKIVQKIRKLLQLANLSRNSNVEEAAAAAAKAQALMEKHRIKEAMLDLEKSLIKEIPLNDQGKPEEWKTHLAASVSRHNGCYIVKSESYLTDNIIHIVGEPQDVETVKELYSYIVNELVKLCLSNIIEMQKLYKLKPNKKYNDSFYQGAINTIDSRLAAANQQARDEELKQAKSLSEKAKLTNALAKIDNKIQNAKDWISKHLNAKIETVPINKDLSLKGYQAGQEAAKSLNLSPKRPKLK